MRSMLRSAPRGSARKPSRRSSRIMCSAKTTCSPVFRGELRERTWAKHAVQSDDFLQVREPDQATYFGQLSPHSGQTVRAARKPTPIRDSSLVTMGAGYGSYGRPPKTSAARCPPDRSGRLQRPRITSRRALCCVARNPPATNRTRYTPLGSGCSPRHRVTTIASCDAPRSTSRWRASTRADLPTSYAARSTSISRGRSNRIAASAFAGFGVIGANAMRVGKSSPTPVVLLPNTIWNVALLRARPPSPP